MKEIFVIRNDMRGYFETGFDKMWWGPKLKNSQPHSCGILTTVGT